MALRQRRAGGGGGIVDVFCIAARDLVEHLAVRRVDHVEHFAGGLSNIGAVDE
jgi:hypothetical protein